jgi:hypothetical protein
VPPNRVLEKPGRASEKEACGSCKKPSLLARGHPTAKRRWRLRRQDRSTGEQTQMPAGERDVRLTGSAGKQPIPIISEVDAVSVRSVPRRPKAALGLHSIWVSAPVVKPERQGMAVAKAP